VNESACWDAVLARDARHDGEFFYGVTSTGVFCRPSCPSRRPRRENVIFLETAEQAVRAGLRPCRRCRPLAGDPAGERVTRVCRYIEGHLDEPLTLSVLSAAAGLSPFHMQRTFKATLGISPREYADACRLKTLKGQLRLGHNVTRAMTDAGYGSTSRLYERTGAQLGMTPTAYRAGGRGTRIRYAVAESPLGPLLVAATDQGVCSIRFGDNREDLVAAFREEYCQAGVVEDAGEVGEWVERVLRYLVGEYRDLNLPLDIQATAFQRRVWEYLRTIPYGDTRSYAEVAAALERPRAARAVARACASNPVALVIPCHRVVRGTGEPGGYRWGASRKQELLRQERSGRS